MAGAGIVSLLAAEAVLRLFFHAAPQLEANIYRRDEAGALALRPNLRRRHVTPYWDVTIELNDAGMRDERAAPAPGEAVWLGLGDSMAFGWGVELEEAFYSRIEEALGVRLVNAAVPGTGPTDHLERLENLTGRWRARVVLEAVFVGNDFTDAALGGDEQFEVVDGLLMRKPALGEAPARDWRRWLARRSHLAQLVRAVQFNRSRGADSSARPRTWDAWMREFAQIHLAEPNARTRRGEAAVLEALESMRRVAAEQGAELVVIVIPRSVQAYPAELEEMRRALGLEPSELDPDRAQRLLGAWAAERGVALVDPLERMRREARAGERLYYTPDAHLTAAGHRVVAAEALRVLRERIIPR